MLHPRARLGGLLEELQGELGRQTVERALLSGCPRARRPRGHAAAPGAGPRRTLTGLRGGSCRGRRARGAVPAPSPTGRAARGQWRRRAWREGMRAGLGALLTAGPTGGHALHSPQLVLVVAQAHGQQGGAPELPQPPVQLLGHKVEPESEREAGAVADGPPRTRAAPVAPTAPTPGGFIQNRTHERGSPCHRFLSSSPKETRASSHRIPPWRCRNPAGPP